MIPRRQGLILLFLPLLHFLQCLGDFQLDSTFSTLYFKGVNGDSLVVVRGVGGEEKLGGSKWGAAFSWNCK